MSLTKPESSRKKSLLCGRCPEVLYEESPIAIAVTNLRGEYLDCNPAFERFTGYSKAELKDLSFHKITHPDDLQETVRTVEELVAGRQDTWRFRKRYVTKAGDVRWGELLLRMVRDDAGRPQFLIPFIMDITAQKEAEVLAATSAEVVRRSNALMLMMDCHGSIVYVSPTIREILGYEPHEVLGYKWWEATADPETDIEDLIGRLRAIARREAPLHKATYERSVRAKDGSFRRISWSDAYGPNGTLIGVGQDVTEQRETEAILQAVFEHSRDAVLVFDNDGKILLANRAAPDVFGCSEEKVKALNWKAAEPQRWAQFLAVGTQTLEVPLQGGQEQRVLHYSAVAHFLPGKHLTVVRDITEKKRIEQQLAQAAKVEAIGQLAGGVAHDFNNLLMVISSYGQLLQDAMDDQDVRRRYTQQILTASDRGAALTGQLLAFSRRQVLRPRVTDIADLVKDTSGMLRRLMGEDVVLTVSNPRTALRVMADPGQVVQVLMNLCANARDAMPQGGNVRIETSSVCLDETYAHTHAGLQVGQYILISVTDDGHGIPENLRAKIFEPFFTTKPLGKGTGLGLSMVYGIVKQSDGYVWVYSEGGKGTTFKIYLPQVHNEVDRPAEAAKASELNYPARVLVVEDEPMLRTSISEYLRARGYTVFEAGDANSAERQVLRMESKIDLLLTDVVMPHVGGRELAERIGALDPEIKVVFMSGYTSDKVIQSGLADANINFLQKPFSLAAMEVTLREVLAGQSDATC